MIEWLKLSDDQRRTSLAQAQIQSGAIPTALEKDWWVTLTLKALFQTQYADSLIFKGGTSLSKCWKLIRRFSEDIDIAMAPHLFGMTYEEAPGRSYLHRLKKAGCEFTSNQLKQALIEQFAALGLPEGVVTVTAGPVLETMRDKDPQELYVKYTSLYEPNPYLPDTVKIEVSVRSKLGPYSAMPIQSLLSEHFPSAAYPETPFSVLAVEPHKTFLEKAFLLHEQFHRGEGIAIKTERMSRHFHDLAQMMDTEIGAKALADKDLYAAIIKHRSYYSKLSGIDYELLHTPHINFYPPHHILAGYQSDYKVMLENMIYGDAPDEVELFELMKKLNQRFNQTLHE